MVELENRKFFEEISDLKNKFVLLQGELDATKAAQVVEASKVVEVVAMEVEESGMVEKLKIEKEQLEKARAQLAGVVKTQREQLAEAKKKTEGRERLLGLVREYQEVLAEVTGSSVDKKKNK